MTPARQPLSDPKTKKPNRASKQSHVIAMLQSSKGTTIATMMKATGYGQKLPDGKLAQRIKGDLRLEI